MAINYLRRVQSYRGAQPQSDVERGIQAGEAIGKLLGGLGTAIQGAQKDALANKLMTQQNISNQPGAGQTVDLGTLPGGPQPAASGGSGGEGPDPDPDPTSINYNIPPGGTGGQAPEPTYTEESMPDLSQAVNQQKAATSLSAQNAQPSGDNWNLSQFGGGGTSVGEGAFPGGGSGTVGGLIGTGGAQGLQLQKEIAEQKISSQNAANTQTEAALRIADARAKASGTGIYATDNALARAKLLEAQKKALGDKPVDLEKNPPPATNLDTEPVINESQLEKTVDGQYYKGAYGNLTRTINEPDTIPDPKGAVDANGKPVMIPNPNGPLVSGDSITLGPKSKRITMPLAQAKILAKQYNSVNFKKGLPLIRVPGEDDQTLGATPDHPYPVNNKLDMVSRAHNTWVKLPPTAQFPNGQIKQVP